MHYIKFRVWTYISRFNGADVSSDMDPKALFYDFPHEKLKWFLAEWKSNVMLFTGLCDKDREEVWERDIILLDSLKYVVEWNNDLAQYYLEPVNNNTTIHPMTSIRTHGKKIGNVYENPELLKDS